MYVNAKNDTDESTTGIGEKRIKKNGRGSEFIYDIFDTL
jgi:hypothetical protein